MTTSSTGLSLRVAVDLRDRVHHVLPGDLAEDGVLAVEPAVRVVVMKNWLPFVSGPALAIESVPRSTRLSFASSSNLYPGPPGRCRSGRRPGS